MLKLQRGARATINVTDLKNADGSAAVFTSGDVLIWTMKADYGYPAADALITKTSDDGGITVDVGNSDAAVHIVASDWANIALRADLPTVWDLVVLVGGDSDQAVTLDSGQGLVLADVGADPISDPTPAGGYYSGPQGWVALAEVQADPRAVDSEGHALDPVLLQAKIDVASALLYRFSGRQFSGIITTDPALRPTSRWYRSEILPATPWWWQWPRPLGMFTTRNPHRQGGGQALSEISLGVYPLVDIVQILIDGQVIDPATYAIHDRRWLVRTDPSGIGWPAYQDLSLPSTEVGTFQVIAQFGQPPDRGGVDAAKIFAIELAKGASGDACNLPQRVVSIQSQNVALGLLDPMSYLDKGRTGIYEIDVWLAAVNPSGLRRRSSVLSPDIPRPVRRIVNPITGS